VARLLRRYPILTPALLLAPGILWLAIFYVYPAFQMFLSSFWSGSLEKGFTFSLSNWTTYPNGFTRYTEQFGRSVVYAGAATILTFLIAYPLAFAIAFKGGRYRNLLTFLVIAPFFTSFLLRTISWRIILGDDGVVLGPLKQAGLVDPGFHVLASPIAVVAGITYNFLPFMTLPIYVSLEKIDRRLVEAAQDLYAGPWRPGGTIAGVVVAGGLLGLLCYAFNWTVDGPALGAWGTLSLPQPIVVLVAAIVGGLIGTLLISESFVRVTFPLSLPGVFAGSLLVMIPAIGDYVNASLLGNPSTNMIGNVIQSRFLTNADYPTASALSFILMAAILVTVSIYARLLGTENLSAGRGL
jgi:spermidine/putrescine transport system permease protein